MELMTCAGISGTGLAKTHGDMDHLRMINRSNEKKIY